MFLFGIAAFADFINQEIALGNAITFKCWHLIIAAVVIAALIAALIVVCCRASKKGKRRYEEVGETIDVSEKKSAETEKYADPEYETAAKEEPAEEKEEVVSEQTEEKEEIEEKAEPAVEEKAEEPIAEEKVEEEIVVAAPVAEEKAEEPVKEEKAEEKAETVAAEEPVKKVVAAKKATKKPVAKKAVEKQPEEKAEAEQVNMLEKPEVKLNDPENKVSFEQPAEEEVKENKVVGKIEICNSDLGGYNYLLLANNGQLLYESKAYKSVDSCKEAIANFIDAVNAGRFTVRADKFKNYKFILKSPTSNTLLYVGESFSTETSCRNNIESVKRFAPISPIVDITTEDYAAKFVYYEIPEELVKDVAEGSGAVGKWEIARVDENSKTSPFVFLLFANNGQLLYESRDYKAESGCLNGLKTFINTVRDGYFVIDPDKSGRYKFVLRSKSTNSPIEYYGQNYDSQKACASSIESVYRFALRSPLPEKNANKQ